MAKYSGEKLVEFCKTKLGVPYVYGMKGAVMTLAKYKELKSKYGSYVWNSDVNKVGKVCCDCSGLISWYTGIQRGSSQYKQIATECHPISTIKEAPVGALVWQSGHIGVYIGMIDGIPYYIAEDGSAYGCRKNKISNANFTHWLLIPNFDYSTSTSNATISTAFAKTEMRGVVTNCKSVNMRVGTGIGYTVRCVIPQNVTVAVQYIVWDNNGSGWYKARYGANEGYISIDYVTLAKDINNIKYAINKLASYEVISSPNYWTAHYSDLKYLENLIINMSLAVTKKTAVTAITDINTALNILKTKKVLTTVEYWHSKYTKVKYLDSLIINVANAIR